MLTQSEGLAGADLLAAFVAHRVLPLQGRPHMICQMSDHLDPSRMCTRDMPHAEVANMVNHIANCELAADWQFGKEPYSRANPSPVVSCIFCSSFFLCSRIRLLILLVSSSQNPLIQPAAGATGLPREFAPDRAESDGDDPDLGAAAMEADAEGGGGGAEGGFRPSATFADWPEDDAEGEVAPRHQSKDGHPGVSSFAGLASQVGARKRHAGPGRVRSAAGRRS